jgi:hypothetical protein
MRFVSGVGDQKFGNFSNSHVIHTALHGAEQMMVQVWDMDGLVDHQVKNFAGPRVIVSDNTADGVIALSAKGGVVPFDINGSIVIEYYQCVAS